MINESFELSCTKNINNCSFSLLNIANECLIKFSYVTADEESDVNPQDYEGTDAEYGSHLNIGQHSFSQMQVKKVHNFRKMPWQHYSNYLFIFIRAILIGSVYSVIINVLEFMKVALLAMMQKDSSTKNGMYQP